MFCTGGSMQLITVEVRAIRCLTILIMSMQQKIPSPLAFERTSGHEDEKNPSENTQ